MLPPELKDWKEHKIKDGLPEITPHQQFVENEAANYWRILPWEFRSLENHQQAELLAHYTVKKKIEYFYANEQLRRSDKITASITGNKNRKTRP